MKRFLSQFVLGLGLVLPWRGPAAVLEVTGLSASPTILVAIGAPGEAQYATNFSRQAELWHRACQQTGGREILIGADPQSTNDLAQLKAALQAEATNGPAPLWIVFIGHGTFDGAEARFNLRGPDVSATELAGWLKDFRRPIAFIDTTSCSAPFLTRLSATNRVVIVATRSGHEQNFTRFGLNFAKGLLDPANDLDRDGEISLLEAFLAAARRTADFYKAEGRLATEHALLDDNGDGLGTQADWFRGLRAVKRARDGAPLDGAFARRFRLGHSDAGADFSAEQRDRRDALEREIIGLQQKKEQLGEDEYYARLEQLLLEMARLYESRHS